MILNDYFHEDFVLIMIWCLHSGSTSCDSTSCDAQYTPYVFAKEPPPHWLLVIEI